MSSSLTNNQINNKKSNKRSSWRWWQHNNNSSNNSNIDQSNKNPNDSDSNDDLVIDEKGSITTGRQDCSLSIAQSSLLVHHSIHSKESEDITSTTSIKSKPWISQQHQPCSSSVTKSDEEETVLEPIDKAESNLSAAKNLDNNNNNNNSNTDTTTAIVTPSSSLLMNVPSMTSSTVPVIDYKPRRDQRHRRKSSDNALFSGFKAKIGKWVNRNNSTGHSTSNSSATNNQ